jgi:hypothetical protein
VRKLRSVNTAKEKQDIQSYFSKDPRKCKLLLDALTDFQAIMEKRRVEDGDLDSIRAAVMENDSQVWVWAGQWLRKLAQVFVVVKSLYCELAQHKSWKVRRHICALLVGTPYELVTELLPKLLEDRSSKVRMQAVTTTLWTRRRKLIPLLEARASAETDEKVIDWLDLTVALLRHGKTVRSGQVVRLTKHGLEYRPIRRLRR